MLSIILKVCANVRTMSWLLSSICCLKIAVEAFVRLGIACDGPPKRWFLPKFTILAPDPCNSEDVLTKGSENIDAMFIRLAISVVGMPYGCSRPIQVVENPRGIVDRDPRFILDGGVPKGPLGPLRQQ